MTDRVPLRTQLLVLLLGTVGLVVLVSGLAGTAALRSYLVERIDDQLMASAGMPTGGPGGMGRRGPRRDVAVTTLEYDASGALRAVSAARLLATGGPEVDAPQAMPHHPIEVPDVEGDRRWRVLATGGRDGGYVVVGVPLDGVEDTSRRLLVINLAVGLLVLAGSGVLTGWAVRRSLRPLVQVEATAQAIAAGDLSVRVPAGDPRTEVGSLAASFNAMVDRFESAWSAQQRSEVQARASEERMRRFVADASHELRTPLTSIRGFAELVRQGAAEQPGQRARAMRRIEDESVRMGLLVEDLLLLARLDSAQPLRREHVDLLAVAADVVHDAATLPSSTHTVRLLPPIGTEPPVVLGDPARLHQVVGNLVGNAVAHTPDGSTVEVRVSSSPGEVAVEVRDDGEGMAPDVAARVFERFYRADASRTRAGAASTGTGLGLSIVAALVAAHGGTVDLETGPGSGSAFTVRLPTG